MATLQSLILKDFYIQCREQFWADVVPSGIKDTFKVVCTFEVFGIKKVLVQALEDTSFPELVDEQNWTSHRDYFWGSFASLFFKETKKDPQEDGSKLSTASKCRRRRKRMPETTLPASKFFKRVKKA